MVPLRPGIAPWITRGARRAKRSVMSILILRGAHPGGHSFNSELLRSLQQLGREAGRIIEVCTCTGLRDFIAGLRWARSQKPEFVLLDPGNITQEAQAHPEAGLRDALDQLSTPYIEVHDDSATALDAGPYGRRAPLATIVINGDLSTSYRIALGIALRQLSAIHC
jgi:3-dehydroquinate dehydratase-2